jgi:predicted RNase H-like nuclease
MLTIVFPATAIIALFTLSKCFNKKKGLLR